MFSKWDIQTFSNWGNKMTKPSTIITRKPLEQLNDHVWRGAVTSKLTLRVRCRSVSLASHSFCWACACFTSSPPHPQACTTEGQCHVSCHHSTTTSPGWQHSVLHSHSTTTLPGLNHRGTMLHHVITQQPHFKAWTTEGQCYVMSPLNNHVLTQQSDLKAWTTETMLCVMLSLCVLTQQPHFRAWTTEGQC